MKGKEKKILDSNSVSAVEVTSDIVMDPAFCYLSGCIQALDHGISDSDSDTNIRTRESSENFWVGIEELHFGNAVGFQKFYNL